MPTHKELIRRYNDVRRGRLHVINGLPRTNPDRAKPLKKILKTLSPNPLVLVGYGLGIMDIDGSALYQDIENYIRQGVTSTMGKWHFYQW